MTLANPRSVVFAALLASAGMAAADDKARSAPEDFPKLLDQLQAEQQPFLRGGDMVLNEAKGSGRQVIELLGRPDTWDAFGTQALRDAVIQRWRQQWHAQGVKMLNGLQPAKPIEGRQDLDFGPIHHSRETSDMRTPYFLAGPKIYSLGGLDGSYPPAGRMLGDQSGIWAQPVKLLDGIGYTVVEPGAAEWPLVGSRYFATDLASGTFHYERESLRITRVDFAAEDTPAFFSQVTLENKLDRPGTLILKVVVPVNIRPNWRTWIENDLDRISEESGWVYAKDPLIHGGDLRVGGERAADRVFIENNIATLSYRIDLPARGKVTRNFLVLAQPGSTEPERRRAFESLVTQTNAVLAEKREHYRKVVFDGVRFTADDKQVEDAFYLAKANLQMLTADLRPWYPAPYFYAGLPVYMQLFSNDTSYSIPGATAAGFSETARGALVSLAEQAKQLEGWIPHEVATSFQMTGRGNSQEIQQTIGAAWHYFRWTGDLQFLKGFYPQALESIAFALRQFDADNDGYPEGSALIETHGMGPKKLDAATYLYDAYRSIAGMAEVLGDPKTAKTFARRAGQFQARFRKDWWMEQEGIWADSLTHENTPRLDGYWSIVFPQYVGIGTADQARVALDTLERRWVNQWGLIGRYVPGEDITQSGVGVVHNNVFATTLFRGGRADSGWSMLRKAARAAYADRMLGTFAETIPPGGGSDFIQLWSVGPFLEAYIEGLAGIEPDAWEHRVKLSLGLPKVLNRYALDGLRLGAHLFNVSHVRERGIERKTLTHVSGNQPLTVTLSCPASGALNVKVDGSVALSSCKAARGPSTATVDIIVPSGSALVIETTAQT